jgi:hypothetical protein
LLWLETSEKLAASRWGLSYFAFGLGIGTIIYILLLARPFAMKSTAKNSALIILLLQALSVITLMNSTGQLQSMYMILWGVLVLISGIFGSYAIIGSSFFMTIYFIVVATSPDTSLSLKPIGVAYWLATYAVAILSYIVWRKWYASQVSWQVQQLSGALMSRQQQANIL